MNNNKPIDSESQSINSEKTSAPTQLTPNQSTDNSNEPLLEKRKFPFFWLAIALLGGCMFLPFPFRYQIVAKAELEGFPGSRSFVRNGQSMPCTIKQIFVKVGNQVKEGDKLAELSCRTLDEDIYKIKSEINQAKFNLAGINNKLVTTKVNIEVKKAESLAIAGEAARMDDQALGGIAESQINKLESEKKVLQTSLELALNDRERFKYLLKEKIGSQRDLEKAETTYKQLIATIEVKDREIQSAQRQLSDSAQKKKSEADVKAIDSEGSQSIYDTNSEIDRLTEVIANLEDHLKYLESQSKDLTLRANISGTIYAEKNIDFDMLVNKELQAGAEIMQIYDANKLLGRVKIDQRDNRFVTEDAEVQFRPEQEKSQIYKASINRKPVNISKPEDSNQSRLSEVLIKIDNDNPNRQKLSPNATGYAKIYYNENMSVFRRLQVEFERLLDTRFW
jgi:multidrug efflux pump subunit AcrA (membrane-fusion protein)